jgi:uncharacterized membrane protein
MIGRVVFFILLYVAILAVMGGAVSVFVGNATAETTSSLVLVLLLMGAYWGMFRRHSQMF